MSAQNTVATLDGLFKEVYGEGPINLVPESAYIQKRIPFKEAQRVGKSYNFPVVLSQEHGVTYLAAGAGISTLEDSVAAVLKDCEVDANQLILRGQMDYEAAAKAQSSKVAFKNASELLVENLMDSAGKRLEIAMLYGRSPNGLAVTSARANINATSTNITFTAASWAPGIWSGLEGAKIQFYAVSGDTLVSSGADSVFTVTAVNFTSRVVTVTGTSTGITALDTAVNGGAHYVHFKGARTAEPIGIDRIIQNSGTLFGINAASYSLWQGNNFSVGGALSVAKLLEAVSLAVGRGGLQGEADVLLSPKVFMSLSATLDGLRRHSPDDKTGVLGFETLEMFGPNGKMKIVAHPMVKEGEGFIFPAKRLKRIGSSEMTFQTPGRKDEIFLHVPNQNAYELRLYCAQAIVCEAPAQMVRLHSIS